MGAKMQHLGTTRALSRSKLACLIAVTAGLVVVSTPTAGVASVPSSQAGALLATLQDPGASSHDYFGQTVAVSGKTIVIGSPGVNADRNRSARRSKTPALLAGSYLAVGGVVHRLGDRGNSGLALS